MQTKANRRRPRGTGSLITRANTDGTRSWVAQWYDAAGTRHKRAIGKVRAPGATDGLNRTQAGAKLHELIGETPAAQRTRGDRPTVADVSRRYLRAPAKGGRPRKPSTVENVQSEVRVHLEPFFGDRPVDRITADDVADLIAALEAKDLVPKTIRNVIGTLSALMNFAKAPRRRWAAENPCDGAELPEIPETDEIRFLTMPELRTLVGHARAGIYQEIDRVLYLVAAMTGLRLGELLALRWRDVDWTAGVIRVRRNYVRGRYGTPKSRRSSRAVPMADEIGGTLDRLFKASRFQGDDQLVFVHPATGSAIAKANVTRRLHLALADARLDDTHVFHDLRHTFGTTMAAHGVPMRTLQEWMGHKHIATTERYADYAPRATEGEMISAAFADGHGSCMAPNCGDLIAPESVSEPGE
jgi:integrase